MCDSNVCLGSTTDHCVVFVSTGIAVMLVKSTNAKNWMHLKDFVSYPFFFFFLVLVLGVRHSDLAFVHSEMITTVGLVTICHHTKLL